jgi:hypothetical protein
MTPIVRALLAFVASLFRSRVSLQLEILALPHQLAVYQESIRRPHVRSSDRILWSWLSRGWARTQAGGPGLRAASNRARLAAHGLPCGSEGHTAPKKSASSWDRRTGPRMEQWIPAPARPTLETHGNRSRVAHGARASAPGIWARCRPACELAAKGRRSGCRRR